MRIFYFLLITAIFFGACKSSTEENTSETEATTEQVVVEKVEAVCVSNGTPLRAEPNKEGKYLSSLNLGETFLYLGESATDSNDTRRKYYKVELSDGSVAWARTYGVKVDAKPAAITNNTPIYKRPDLVTKTDKELKVLEFIAIISEKEEWIEVVGEGSKKSGWIMKQNITTNMEDVATATLASKELLKNGEIQQDKIIEFIEASPYQSSQFIAYLQNMLDAQVEEAVLESIEEYETTEDAIYD